MSDCILWHASISTEGYGHFERRGRHILAHRHIWQECIGPIPRGHVLHHRCASKSCVNPEHLELLTRGEHMRMHDNIHKARRKAVANKVARTHCKHGHAYAEHVYWRSDGGRDCHVCMRARQKR